MKSRPDDEKESDMNQQIVSAIISHGKWRERLESAIESGKCRFEAKDVDADDGCDFGKWLYSLPDRDKDPYFCLEVRELHRHFHHSAAKVLKLALAGKKDEARKAMADGSEYSEISIKLIQALSRWESKLLRPVP